MNSIGNGLNYTSSPFSAHYDIDYRVFKNPNKPEDIDNPIEVNVNFSKKDHFNVLHLDENLSFSNKTLASASVLSQVKSSFDFYDLLVNLHSQEFPIEYEWASIYKEKYEELHKKIKVRNVRWF